MREEDPESESRKKKFRLYRYLTLVSLFLFALLWSLGAFFFWLLLGLACCLGILTLYYSKSQLALFNETPRPNNPYRAYQQRPAAVTPSGQFFRSGRMIRVFVITLGAITSLLLIIGTFSSEDNDGTTETSEPELVEPEQIDDATLFTDKGNSFFNESQYDSALKYYEKVLAVNPANQYALYNKALVFFMKKDYWGSISIIKKCLRNHPDYNEGLWLLGDDFFSVSYYDSAVATLEKARRNQYNDPGFLELLGDVYMKKNNRTMAAEVYKEVLAQDSSKFEVYRQLAELDPTRAAWYRKKADEIEASLK